MQSPSDNQPPGGYFPLSVIRAILFGDERIPTRSRSKAPNDFAKVIHVPIGVGLYLASLDPTELYFHVESFPETSHSEVWLPFEWQESSARQGRLRTSMATERAIRDKHSSRIQELTAVMPGALSSQDKSHLAETILHEMSYQRYDKVLQYLNVAELYIKYEQEDKKETNTDNQREPAQAGCGSQEDRPNSHDTPTQGQASTG